MVSKQRSELTRKDLLEQTDALLDQLVENIQRPDAHEKREGLLEQIFKNIHHIHLLEARKKNRAK